MDNNQKQELFRAIAISTATSPILTPLINQQSRAESYNKLEEFKKYNGRVAIILELLQTETLVLPVNGQHVDITASTKLYALGVLQTFLKTNYSKLDNEGDRLAIRNAVMMSARQLLSKCCSSGIQDVASENESRFLGVKIAALIADIATRDFPQRWTTFISDLFSPPDKGGLWYVPSDASISKGYGPLIGVKICLECLKIITEDCTDGDFNSKISTSRRNDVLIGLNEVNGQFLPLIFELISFQYSLVNNAKGTITEMCNYLVSTSRTVYQMTPQEKPMFEEQVLKRDNAGKIVADCLSTLEKFCQSMPIEWMLSNLHNCDFISALLHLLREDTADIHVLSVACLQQIVLRKIDYTQWLRLVSSLPGAINEANDASTKQESIKATSEGKTLDNLEVLVDKYPFHRALSKMLAYTISAHIAHITNDKDITKERGQNFQVVTNFLILLADMLSHPSPRICGEQSNTWAILLRDPQLSKTQTRLLQPCFERLIVAYSTHLVRIRWEDVEEQNHPYAALFEESFSDRDEYDLFLGDLRSKANLIFRMIGGIDPELGTSVLYQKFEYLFATYANGGVRDHLDPTTGELTQQSTAVMELEGFNLPLDNLIHGLPKWALDDTKKIPSYMDPSRVKVRNEVKSMLGNIATKIIAWNPKDTWLKFRRVTLMEALKYYWEYDATRLISAIDAFLLYLGDETPTSVGIQNLSPDVISLRKKAGVSLIAVTKKVPHLLVSWLGQLSERVKSLLSMSSILPANRMHLYEFLSCVATAVDDPTVRSKFIADVLSDALTQIESTQIKEAIGSVDGLLTFLGVTAAGSNPASVTDEAVVGQVTSNFVRLFSAFNQLLSVGKRCHEAAKSRPNAGIPLSESQLLATQNQDIFPDEGTVSISDLSMNDPFVHLWPRIVPSLMQVLNTIFSIWHPSNQAKYLKDPVQRFIYAISDDEAYLAKNQGSISNGGVFGEDGTAGSVVSGWDRRACNLAPKWSGWFNELRGTCLQLLGLVAAQRALFSPEISPIYPSLVSVVANTDHLNAMEHRHMSQYIKQFMDYILLSCPSTLYQSHVAPIAAPFFQHMEHRLKCTWAPVLKMNGIPPESTKPLMTGDCETVALLAQRGGDEWIVSYYARGGAFVGDLDAVISEALVEKLRVEVSRCYADMLQAALALKGDWALVLANAARDEQATKKGDSSVLASGPKSKVYDGKLVNADGSERSKFYYAIEARKQQRIDKLCHFLLLENETIAGYLVLSVVECLNYPDAYTCRRCLKICHRILETVSWVDRYTHLLGFQMFTYAVRGVIYEQRWMVGIEWDMINVIRDIYCRLVLGQSLQCGGQGAAMQSPMDATGTQFEQTKVVDKPLQGGGILCKPSDLPRQALVSLPGISPEMVMQLEAKLKEKRSAKDQKDTLRDILRIAADNLKENENGDDLGMLGRADVSESLLNQKESAKKDVIQDLPERLVTQSMIMKKSETSFYTPDSAEMGANLFE
jgi:Importin beta-related nuclear transport receptor